MFHRILLFLTFMCLLQGCQPKIPDNSGDFNGHEQLYIDARHGFTLNLPQAWERMTIPVSDSSFRQDTVVWKLESGMKQATLLKVLSVQRTQFATLQKFCQYSHEVMHQNENVSAHRSEGNNLSGHRYYDGKEILYFNLAHKHRYFYVSLISSQPITEQMKKSFTAVVESLQEIAP